MVRLGMSATSNAAVTDCHGLGVRFIWILVFVFVFGLIRPGHVIGRMRRQLDWESRGGSSLRPALFPLGAGPVGIVPTATGDEPVFARLRGIVPRPRAGRTSRR